MTDPPQPTLTRRRAQLLPERDCPYAELCDRLEADLDVIRADIKIDDPACWRGHLPLINFRFFASRLDLREIVNRIAASVDPLIDCATRGDALECLQALHRSGCPLSSPIGSDDFLIHVAARFGADRVLGWLIDEGIFSIDAITSGGTTALHHAAYGGRTKTVELLLARGAFVDSATSHGETPLHAAIRGGYMDIVRLLVEAGANLGATVDGGNTPLNLAATYNLWGCVRLLLSRGAPWKQALPALIELRGTKVLSEPELADPRLQECSQDHLGRLFLSIAPDEARILLDRGADPSKAAVYALRNTGHRLLTLIKQYRDFRYLEVHYRSAALSVSGMIQLLDEGGDPNAWVCRKNGKRVPLVFYVATEVEAASDVVPLLLGRGADPSRPAEAEVAPLLSELLKRGCCTLPLLQQLVRRGEDINAADRDGTRALHELLTPAYSWTDSSQALLEVLLDMGAEVNIQDTQGLTPLMLAANLFYADASKRTAAVLGAGADIRAQDVNGRSVLHHLFESTTDNSEVSECQAVLNLLLQSGADIFVRDQRGQLPEEAGDRNRVQSERLTLRRLRERLSLSNAGHPGLIRRPRL
jgi:ankyrin repeat protein